jgi:hypothetical protein
LAIIRFGVIVAIAIVESNIVLVAEFATPQVQEAVG